MLSEELVHVRIIIEIMTCMTCQIWSQIKLFPFLFHLDQVLGCFVSEASELNFCV